MRGPEFEYELMLVAEIDRLQVLALVQVPEMQTAAVFRAEQDFRDQAIFESIRRAPLAGDERIMAKMPPDVIGKLLWPAIHFPLAAHLEGLVIHQKNAAWRLALGIAKCCDIDPFRPAMDGMRP